MGRTRDGDGRPRRRGAPVLSSFPSPSPSSSSSSDFEFTVSVSPSSKRSCSQLCPADELFYMGQLLPLHPSHRISMVRTLLLASASASSSTTDTATTASRDSNGSSSSFSAADLLPPGCDSSRPSSAAEEDARRVSPVKRPAGSKYLSSLATRLSSVFLHRGSKKLDPSADHSMSMHTLPPPPTKRANSSSSSSAKEVIRKYVKKVKPIYEKLSSLQQRQDQHPPQQQQQRKKTFSFSIRKERILSGSAKRSVVLDDHNIARGNGITYSSSLSFNGNLLGGHTRKQWAASCPSSMRSSPSHSGLLYPGGGGFLEPPRALSLSASSMEELQSAIAGAIAHCKSSLVQANQKNASGLISNDDEIARS